MPIFNDAGQPDTFSGFVNLSFADLTEIVIDVQEELSFPDLASYSSYAVLWWATLRVGQLDPTVIKFWKGVTNRANYGSYLVTTRSTSTPFEYLSQSNTNTGNYKYWSYNPSFYAGNRYIPAQGAFAALLSGEFPFDLGVNPKPIAAFSSVSSSGDALRVFLSPGVLTFDVTITFLAFGTSLFPGPSAPVTFIEI